MKLSWLHLLAQIRKLIPSRTEMQTSAEKCSSERSDLATSSSSAVFSTSLLYEKFTRLPLDTCKLPVEVHPFPDFCICSLYGVYRTQAPASHDQRSTSWWISHRLDWLIIQHHLVSDHRTQNNVSGMLAPGFLQEFSNWWWRTCLLITLKQLIAVQRK